jgi:hypothetical protein
VTPSFLDGAAFQVPLAGFLEDKPCPHDVTGGADVSAGLVAAGQSAELRPGDALARGDMPAAGAAL